jgi:hypothetical protein
MPIGYLGKELGDLFIKAGDEGGERGVVRRTITAEGDEGDVFAA